MSNQIRDEYEQMSGRNLQGPFKSPQSFGGLLYFLFLLTLFAVGWFGADFGRAHFLAKVEPGEIVLCPQGEGVQPLRKIGYHWCLGKKIVYQESRDVGFRIQHSFDDRVPAFLEGTLSYDLSKRRLGAWDPAVSIWRIYVTQENFENFELRPRLQRALSQALARAPGGNMAAPVVNNLDRITTDALRRIKSMARENLIKITFPQLTLRVVEIDGKPFDQD